MVTLLETSRFPHDVYARRQYDKSIHIDLKTSRCAPMDFLGFQHITYMEGAFLFTEVPTSLSRVYIYITIIERADKEIECHLTYSYMIGLFKNVTL